MTMQPTPRLRLQQQKTAFLLVDVQEKLVPVIPPEPMARAIANLRLFGEISKTLRIPLWITEQYPKGLGHTLAKVREGMPADAVTLSKVEFSCAQLPDLRAGLQRHAIEHLVVAGMETHICVLQSVIDLCAMELDVWVLEDACVSRTKANWRAGLQLCASAGATVAPIEAVMFLLLERAGTAEFKTLSQLIK